MSEIKLDETMIDELFEVIIKSCEENNIEIIGPNDMKDDGGKIGYEADHQLNIIHELGSNVYSFNFGPAGNTNYKLTRNNAIAEIGAALIGVSRGYNLQFVSLVVPRKAVEIANQVLKDKIFIRYIVNYMPMSDCLAERWDILIKKVSQNV